MASFQIIPQAIPIRKKATTKQRAGKDTETAVPAAEAPPMVVVVEEAAEQPALQVRREIATEMVAMPGAVDCHLELTRFGR
jgi:hypothetical protein